MKKRIYVALLAVGITFVTGCMSLEEIKAANAKAREAKEKAEAEKFAEAKKRADAGDGRMASQTGFMLEKGIGVKQDSKLAITYYERAIQTGSQRPSWHILNLIYTIRDTEHSKLFGDCYQWTWDNILSPNIWNTKNKPKYKSYEHFKKSYENSVIVCLHYLDLLKKSGKDADAYTLKKRLISIVQKKPSGADGYAPSMVTDFLKRLEKIKTETELLEQKKEAEEKIHRLEQNQQLKYPNSKLGKGIKLYKDLYAGSSLEWLRADAAVSNKKIKSISRPMFEDEFLPEIPEIWRGQTFRQNYAVDDDGSSEVSYIFAGSGKEQTMIGCCIILQNVQVKSIVEKYQKEFPGLKIQEKRVPRIRFIAMHSKQVRISVVLMQPGNFVSIFIADPRYIDWYRNMIRKTEEAASKKALDF